jgi:aspartokinase-like uncharacterized kinase
MLVIKIGGSLIAIGRLLVNRISEYAEEMGEKILIVPGGGVFAERVRNITSSYGVSDNASHWMAVLAMEQFGYYLGDGTKARLVESLEEIQGRGAYILLPYKLLKARDELAHTWDVTSDTIAAWIARQLGARLIKATDVDGVYLDGVLVSEIDAKDLIGRETCVDSHLPIFLRENKMDCLVLDGRCLDSIAEAIQAKKGTLIKGNV